MITLLPAALKLAKACMRHIMGREVWQADMHCTREGPAGLHCEGRHRAST